MNGETPRFCTFLESYFYNEVYSQLKRVEEYLNMKKETDSDKCKTDKKQLLSVNLKNRNNQVHKLQEFMKKNKFILRNNFDGNNIEQFLLSKEEDFDNSFLLINDIIDNKQ